MGGLGCDNMTVILVCLLNGNSYEDLAKKCARPVDQAKKLNGPKAGTEEDIDVDLTWESSHLTLTDFNWVIVQLYSEQTRL